MDAKHPVLLLRHLRNTTMLDHNGEVTDIVEVDSDSVVGNSFELTQHAPALVISGPNAGGKTIVLKVQNDTNLVALIHREHAGYPILSQYF